MDTLHGICGKWEILNSKTLNAVHREDFTLRDKECDGIIGFKYDEFADVVRWAKSDGEE